MNQLNGVLLYTRMSYLEELRDLARAGNRLAIWHAKILSDHIIFSDEEPNSEFFVFPPLSSAGSALLQGWTSSDMRLRESRLYSSTLENGSSNATPDHSVQFHNDRARDLTLIDPYFGALLCSSSDPALELQPFFSRGKHTISIYTNLVRPQLKDFLNWGEWRGESDQTRFQMGKDEAERILNQSRDRELQLVWRIEKQLSRLGAQCHKHSVNVYLHDSRTFPHDRHLSFRFDRQIQQSDSSNFAIADYFALGKGLATLGYFGKSASPSHVYNSDQFRMWSGFGASERDKSRKAIFKKGFDSDSWVREADNRT
jgi:hypothetical protein